MSASTPIKYHLQLARLALPHGKQTFIDKLLAINAAHTSKIMELAQQLGTPLFLHLRYVMPKS